MGYPTHLPIYLNNRCNLACKYCYVAVNVGEPARLTLPQIEHAVDFFLKHGPSLEKRITFLGGEPFLDFPLLAKAIRYIRDKTSSRFPVSVFTNGTFLSADKLDFINRQNVRLILSLDGTGPANDANRTYFRTPTRSVFGEVLKRLEGVPRQNKSVNMVFTQETVGELPDNVEFFYRQGFRQIEFYPSLYEQWSEFGFEVFRKAMRNMESYYLSLFSRPRADPFVMQGIFTTLDRSSRNHAGTLWWENCENLVLGSDGNFHVCDKAMSFAAGEARGSVAGRAPKGLDWDFRSSELAKAAILVKKEAKTKIGHFFCPMGIVFYGQWSKSDVLPLLRNFERVSDIYSGLFLSLIRRLVDNSLFRSIYHMENQLHPAAYSPN